MKKSWVRFLVKHRWVLVTAIVVAYFIFLHFFSLAAVTKIEGDTASRILPAIGPLRNLGLPYKDYWEIAPPWMPFFNLIWIVLFGTKIASFKILHALLILISVFGITRVFYKIFPKPLFAGLSILTTIILLSPRITQFLSIELYALAFGLIGLNILITGKWKYETRGFLGAIFLVLSGQIKEPLAPSIIALLPFLWFVYIKYNKDFRKTLFATISGIILGAIVVFTPLILTGTFNIYLDVLKVKQELFRTDQIFERFHEFLPQFIKGLDFPKLTFIYPKYSLFTLIFESFLIYIFAKIKMNEFGLSKQNVKNKETTFFLRISLNENSNFILIVIAYAIGIWLGISIQDRFSAHYDIPMVFPVVFLIAIFSYIALNSLNRWLFRKKSSKSLKTIIIFFITAVVLLMTFPKKAYFMEYSYKDATIPNFVNLLKAGQQPDLSEENFIKSRTRQSDCIIRIYGWGVGTTYFYSSRRPCTRFFLVNILPEKYNEEYRTSVINNPPVAIIYDLGGADLDTEKFEREVFNFTAVLKNCYQQNAKFTRVYWPKNKSVAERRNCIKQTLIRSKQL